MDPYPRMTIFFSEDFAVTARTDFWFDQDNYRDLIAVLFGQPPPEIDDRVFRFWMSSWFLRASRHDCHDLEAQLAAQEELADRFQVGAA